MTLAEKTKFGPYEIVMPIGAGGMGEVYRGRDTRLGRDVALKVLPEEFAHDAERMARLRREAQVLASLNHPNIAAIYGFEDSSNVHALVMELVEGPTLAARIKVGAIPFEEALPIAKQIAEGLEYAHERGIIHRDLKPSNVKVTPDGAVKILDFGLAKAIEGDPSTTSVENSPTLSAMATHAGFLLGTAAYMSPEQARGKRADRRADIWAFGVVLFEMLSGQRLFSGETTSDTLAAVIRAEPDWSELPAATPPRIRELLQRCLKKEPRQRLQSIGEARIAIEETLSGTGAGVPCAGQAPPLQSTWRRALPWAIAATFIVSTALFALGYFARAPQPARVVVSEISPPANANFGGGGYSPGTPVISPDGQRLAFSAIGSDGKQRLWVRRLDSATAQPLEGTDGATFPFWSPDSQRLAFFANGKLNRIDASGGPALAIAVASNGRGGSWGPDGTILFTPTTNDPLFRVPASGGTPQPVTKLNVSRQEISHRWPQFLPDGKHFLFFDHPSGPENSATYAASLKGGEPKMIVHSDSNAMFAPPGYLLFVRQGTLMAQRFDASSLRLLGEAMPLAERVEAVGTIWLGIFTASENGILVYEAGGATTGAVHIFWYDRSGKQIAETGTPGVFGNPSISADGDTLAVTRDDPSSGKADIWVYDLARGIPARLTFSQGDNAGPAWSLDGKTIAFMSSRSGQFHVYQKAADGSGNTTPLVADDATEYDPVWSLDGRYLIFERLATTPGSHVEIWALPLFGDRKAFPVVQNKQFDLRELALSPDGKWLAYSTLESGRPEIYIVPFRQGSGRWEVSTSGGLWPRWRHDGKELFYLALDNKIMSAQIAEAGSSLSIGKILPLFQANIGPNPGWMYDVSADGKKFVVASLGTPSASAPLTLVTNWPALLKKQP